MKDLRVDERELEGGAVGVGAVQLAADVVQDNGLVVGQDDGVRLLAVLEVRHPGDAVPLIAQLLGLAADSLLRNQSHLKLTNHVY